MILQILSLLGHSWCEFSSLLVVGKWLGGMDDES